MKKNSKILISGIMIMVLAVTMVFTVAEIKAVVFNEPVVVEAIDSDGGSPAPTPAPVVRKSNPIKASGKTVKISFSKVKKKNQTIKRSKVISVSNAKGTVTYKKKSGNKKLVISKKGVVTIKKGLKPGKYKLKVYVKASGNSSYKAATKTVTVTIRILTIENPITVSGKNVEVAGDALAESSTVIARKDAISVSNAKGTVTYTKSSGDEYFTVDKKTGNITVASGTPAGTYKVKVKVTAAGTSKYKKGSETATVAITVTEVTPPSEDPAVTPGDDQPVTPEGDQTGTGN